MCDVMFLKPSERLPKPFYEDEWVTLFHQDCCDILPNLGLIHLTLTDPPYNVGIDYGRATNDQRVNYAQWCRNWFYQCRLLSHSISITPGTVNVSMWCNIAPPNWIIAWYKPGAMGNSPFGVCNWEPILFWGKAKRNRGTDVVVAPIIPDKSLNNHPCPKPIKWATGLVSLLTDGKETVLDPFAGSGTTLVAAKQLGRKSIGIEIELKYCEIAADRLRNTTPSLFTPPKKQEQESLW